MYYALNKQAVFPDPNEADEDGLLAYGGDLSPERLLRAYSEGIFPWPHGDDTPLLWFSPDPRTVLLPEHIHIGRSLKKILKKQLFEVHLDTAFEQVVHACASVKRKEEAGTWITDEIMEGYCRLHTLGYAHSAEAWQDNELVGGLYGVSLGAAFFGESLFTLRNNASKVVLVTLLSQLQKWRFHFVDCQMRTNLMGQLGAVDWERKRFLSELKKAMRVSTRQGMWQIDPELS